MGLLDMGAPQAPGQAAPVGGLLGSAPPQGGGQGLKMAQQLAANPTPQMAQQIVAQMKEMGRPEAAQFEQMFETIGNDTERIKEVADAIVAKLSGGGQ